MANPTNLTILSRIVEKYRPAFLARQTDEAAPDKIHVAIDCVVLGAELGIEPEILFGRLYYDLERRYGYAQGDGRVAFFSPWVGDQKHCVNFPYVAAVVADLQQEHDRVVMTRRLSIIAICISAFSVGLALFAAW